MDISGQINVRDRVALLRLSPQRRKRITGQIGRKVRVASRKRLRTQKNMDGTTWQDRSSKSKRKMLRGLSKRMVVRSNEEQTQVMFNHRRTARIAQQHQFGIDEQFTKRKAARLYGQRSGDDPATRRQAKRLRELNYRVRRHTGNGWKRATIKWITENLSINKAGVIIRSMSHKQTVSQWTIPVPKRSFLGANQTEINDIIQTVFNQTIHAQRA